MTFQSIALWPAVTLLDFVLMLFGSPYLSDGLRSLFIGLIAVWLYAWLAKGLVALVKRLFGFR